MHVLEKQPLELARSKVRQREVNTVLLLGAGRRFSGLVPFLSVNVLWIKENGQ